MKEIRFRAWKPDTNKMEYLPKLYPVQGDVTVCYSLVGLTLMQFTGLKDKNGKEIFEGDIVD
jgi:hypothetical protein